MDNHSFHRNLSITLRVLGSFAALLTVTIALSSCGLYETIFSRNPPAHVLLKEMEKWPHDYYWLMETGVSSRIMGIRASGESISEALRNVDELLSRMKAQWDDIGPLNTAQELVTYFRTHHLGQVADAIEKTLAAHQGQKPAEKFHEQLQAMAIKRGLMVAYREVKGENR